MFYVRLIVEACVGEGVRPVILTTQTAFKSDNFALHLRGMSDYVQLAEPEVFTVSGIRRVATRQQSDVVVVPDGDRLVPSLVLGWWGRQQLSLLIMRESAQAGRLGVPRWAMTAIRRTCIAIASRSRGVNLKVLKPATWVGQLDSRYVRDVMLMSVPSHERRRTQEQWRTDDGRYWFGVLGAITTRKNLPTILAAMGELPPGRFGVLLAGRLDDDSRVAVRDFLPALVDRGIAVQVDDRLLDDSELDSAVMAVDCLVLAHSNEGPSGLFGKAVLAGTRVIAAGAQSLRIDALSYPDHAEWVPLEARGLALAFAQAPDKARPRVLGAENDELGRQLLEPIRRGARRG